MNLERIVTTGRVERGRLKIRNAEKITRQIKHWHGTAEVVITIERKHAHRSLAANAYYWSCHVHLLSEHTGYTPDEIHEYLKARFMPKRLAICDGNGEIVDERVVGGTTRDMNKLDFGEYLREIQRWAAIDLGVLIPDPEDI